MAFTPTRSQIMQVVAKVETTYGTDATPAGGTDDAYATDSPTPVNLTVQNVDLRGHTSSFTRQQSIPTVRLYDISVSWPFQGSGSAGATANGYKGQSALMQCCGITETLSAGVSITLAPSSIANLKSTTAYFGVNGNRYICKGMLGTLTLAGRVNDGVRATVRGQSLYTVPDTTAISSHTGGTNRAQAFLGGTITVTRSGGSAYSPTISGFEFMTNSSWTPILSANSATGLAQLIMIDRAETLSCEIAHDSDGSATLTFAQFHSDVLSPTTHDWAIAWGTTPNLCTLNVDTFQPERVSLANTNGYRSLTTAGRVQHATAESQWSLVIT